VRLCVHGCSPPEPPLRLELVQEGDEATQVVVGRPRARALLAGAYEPLALGRLADPFDRVRDRRGVGGIDEERGVAELLRGPGDVGDDRRAPERLR
jgi:hypothetical protein